jgi:hypothetical protein
LSDVEAWLNDFLFEFRRQCKQLSEEERLRISNLDNFMSHCQMLYLHFKDVNFKYLIVTHDKERNDEDITVYGPIPTYEAVETLESILKDPKWDRELTKEEKEYLWETTNFHDILENTFLSIIDELRKSHFVKPGPTIIGSKSMLTIGSFIWHIRGNITDLKPITIVNKIIEDAKKQAEAARITVKPPSPEPPKPIIKCFCTFFYPPIWIGELPQKTFKEKVHSSFRIPVKAFDTKYKERVLVVNKNGLIAIGEEDHSKASRMLNEIMAIGLLFDLPFFAARELEVSNAQIDPSTLTITSWGIEMISLRSQLFGEEWMAGSKSELFVDRREVEKEMLIKLIQEAQRITQDPEIADFLVFLLEAYTCLQSSEYMQSYIMSWVIIERQVFWLWEKFLREEQITHKRRDKLMNPAYWTVDAILESLNLVGQLSPEDYKELMELKNKRNDIIHEGERVSKDEAEGCFLNAKRIVQQRSAISMKQI